MQLIKEAFWLKNLVNDMGVQQEEIVVFCDCQSTINLSKNQYIMREPNTLILDISFSLGGCDKM
jgi:hypothetical protein